MFLKDWTQHTLKGFRDIFTIQGFKNIIQLIFFSWQMKGNNILEFNFPSAYSKGLIHKTNSIFKLLQKTFTKKMAAINVLFNAALKLPVVYVNLIVDDIFSQHIRSYNEG